MITIDQTTQPQVANDTRSQAEVIVNMEGLIKNHLRAIDKLSDELKQHQEMLNDSLANDPQYAAQDDIVKAAQKERNRLKAELLKRPQLADLSKKIKEIKADKKENQLSLFDYVTEYSRLSGVDEIEDDHGQLYLIKLEGKLVKKSQID